MPDASLLEKEGKIEEAILQYEKELKEDPINERILNRLVVLHHKEKDHKKELKYVKLLIKTHQGYYKGKNRKSSTVNALSNKINLALGRIDKKGNELVVPDVLKKLEKRRERLEGKLK